MGGDFLSDPTVLAHYEEASEILGFPLLRLVREGPADKLDLTQWAQPALFVLGYCVAQKLLSRGLVPQGLLGHSLGELTALAVAGVFSFSVGVRLTHLRGRAMQEAIPPEESWMVAVMGLDFERMMSLVREGEGVYIANWNHPQQVVLSGKKADLQAFIPVLKKSGARRLVPLRVSAPFHSPYMENARMRLKEFLSQIPISPPRYPVYSNVTALPYPQDLETIRELLSRQVVEPVLWVKEVQSLPQGWKGIELPPAGVLAGLVRRISPHTTVYEIASPADLEILFKN